MSDPTQLDNLRYSALRQTELKTKLGTLTPSDVERITQDEMLSGIFVDVIALLDAGVPWADLEHWFAEQGLPGITEASWHDWVRRTKGT